MAFPTSPTASRVTGTRRLALAVALVLGAAGSPAAHAAQTIGSDLSRTPTNPCQTHGCTAVQTYALAYGVSATSDGVVVAFRLKHGAVQPPIATFGFKILAGERPTYSLVSQTTQEEFPDATRGGGTDTFIPADSNGRPRGAPIKAGQHVAAVVQDTSGQDTPAVPIFAERTGAIVGVVQFDHNSGTQTYEEFSDYEVLVNATVEPDADGDGYGDETQDNCPTQANDQTSNPCAGGGGPGNGDSGGEDPGDDAPAGQVCASAGRPAGLSALTANAAPVAGASAKVWSTKVVSKQSWDTARVALDARQRVHIGALGSVGSGLFYMGPAGNHAIESLGTVPGSFGFAVTGTGTPLFGYGKLLVEEEPHDPGVIGVEHRCHVLKLVSGANWQAGVVEATRIDETGYFRVDTAFDGSLHTAYIRGAKDSLYYRRDRAAARKLQFNRVEHVRVAAGDGKVAIAADDGKNLRLYTGNGKGKFRVRRVAKGITDDWDLAVGPDGKPRLVYVKGVRMFVFNGKGNVRTPLGADEVAIAVDPKGRIHIAYTPHAGAVCFERDFEIDCPSGGNQITHLMTDPKAKVGVTSTIKKSIGFSVPLSIAAGKDKVVVVYPAERGWLYQSTLGLGGSGARASAEAVGGATYAGEGISLAVAASGKKLKASMNGVASCESGGSWSVTTTLQKLHIDRDGHFAKLLFFQADAPPGYSGPSTRATVAVHLNGKFKSARKAKGKLEIDVAGHDPDGNIVDENGNTFEGCNYKTRWVATR